MARELTPAARAALNAAREPLYCSQGGVPYNKPHLEAKDAEIERLRTMQQGYREEASELRIENDRLRSALQRIERWFGEFPETGKTWPETGDPVSYGACYGSNGERDYMREVARKALA